MPADYQLKTLHHSVAISEYVSTSLMSEEQLKAFIAKAKDDTSIQEKLKAAKTADDVVDIAKEHGHEFTQDHMQELSEEELEGVAGGTCLGFLLESYVKCGL